MIHLSNKAKQYGLIALKVLILTGTFAFIYQKITSAESLHPLLFSELWNHENLSWIPLFLLMVLSNWTLEIIKWKTVVSHVKNISFRTAAKHCLMSLSASLATPNRIGEYGAKALYFIPKNRKKIMVLNLFSNVSQLFATLLFGIPGLLIFVRTYKISITGWKLALVMSILFLLLLIAYYFRQKELLIKGLSIAKLLAFLRTLPKIVKIKVLLFSIMRYAIFSSLFYLVLHFFGGDLSYREALPLMTSMYFLASIVPTFFLFDVAIKGGVALWLFSFTETTELAVLCTVLSMWILNFGIPAIWGSYYVARFKPVKV